MGQLSNGLFVVGGQTFPSREAAADVGHDVGSSDLESRVANSLDIINTLGIRKQVLDILDFKVVHRGVGEYVPKEELLKIARKLKGIGYPINDQYLKMTSGELYTYLVGERQKILQER